MNKWATILSAQYALKEVSGADQVSWQGGVSCRLPALRIKGGIRQAGTDGKNLFIKQGAIPSIQKGVTVSYDAETQEFTLNGTLDANGDIILSPATVIPWCPGQTCTISVSTLSGSVTFAEGSGYSYGFSLFAQDRSRYIRGSITQTTLPPLYSFTATAPPESGGEGYILYLQCWRVGTVFNNLKLRIQIEAGSTATDWAPCVRPLPGNPQAILPNNGVFVSRGANLYRKTGTPSGGNGLTVTYDEADQTYTINGTTLNPGNAILSVNMPLDWKIGASYSLVRQRISGTVTFPSSDAYLLWSIFSSDSSQYSCRTRETSANTAQEILRQAVESSTAFAPSPDGTGYRIYLQCLGSGGIVFDNYKIHLMIVPLNHSVSKYIPYFDGGTATAPDLYAIPDTGYEDEWDAATGKGIRRCGVIAAYADEDISTPYVSSEGTLVHGATVVYGIPDTPFETAPAGLTMSAGYGQIIQTGGNIPNAGITPRYLTHS